MSEMECSVLQATFASAKGAVEWAAFEGPAGPWMVRWEHDGLIGICRTHTRRGQNSGAPCRVGGRVGAHSVNTFGEHSMYTQ